MVVQIGYGPNRIDPLTTLDGVTFGEAYHTASGQSIIFLETHQKYNSFLEPVFRSYSRWSG